jgi:hypothetical protein
LTEAAQKQLKADISLFEVTDHLGNSYFDGPSYFFAIADFVDPDNAHLVENVRKELRTLNVKDYGYSVIKMLAEFKNLRTRIQELGGTYDQDDQFLDFWESLKTMKEKEFARYVKQEKDIYRKMSRANRGRIEVFMKDMTDKEVAMRTDKEWNVMSPEDAMIVSLVSVIEGGNSKSKEKKKGTNKNKNDNKDSDSSSTKDTKPAITSEEAFKKKDAKIPDWKKIPPKEGEKKTKEKDSKTYYWCSKCRNGKGMWALHKESDHKFSFKSNNKDKKVSFTAETKNGEAKGTPTIQVSKNLMSNAKAYLARLGQDFPEGGTQGH